LTFADHIFLTEHFAVSTGFLVSGYCTDIDRDDVPVFLMFPGMGFGIMGLKGPAEYVLLRTAVLNHLFYGIGLTLTFRWLLK
jgi:hypothetical protein